MNADDRAGATERVSAETLTDEQLSALLDGWNPGIAGLSPRPMLLAATRNRYYNGMVPRELVAA